MQTQTKTLSINGTSSLGDSKLMELPILKHFSESEIATKIDKFGKGEKGLFNFLKLIFFGGLAVAFCMYALPKIMVMVGAAVGAVLSVATVILAIILAPVGVRWMRKLAKTLHKNLIKSDPFGQLAEERKKIVVNQETFRIAKGGIDKIKLEMANEAEVSEREAKDGQKAVIRLQGKASGIKTEMDDMIKKMGKAAESEDSYVQLAAEFQSVNAEASRVIQKMNQSNNYVQKYGSRANIMKKLSQKLIMVETAMSIKLADFDATVEMLKKDFDFAKKSSQATTAAKNAMLFQKGWELDYALDVVTTTIANDIAITAGNLKDINLLTVDYSLDSDDLYANLNEIADKIKVGSLPVAEAKQYNNPNYKLTGSDKVQSGGLDNIFN